jgi:hypothetical protein
VVKLKAAILFLFKRQVFLTFLGWTTLEPLISQAQDAVPKSVSKLWLAPPEGSADAWEKRGVEVRSVEVLDFDERDILVVEANGAKLRLDANKLQAVEVHWGSEAAQKAHEAFRSQDHSGAIERAKAAIGENVIPRWQQKILAVEMTDSLVGLKQLGAAGRVFVSLCRESPPAFLYSSIPLNFINDRPDSLLAGQSEEWIENSSSEVAQLLGASWLLGTNRDELAKASLGKLARSKNQTIAQLAVAQTWRGANPKEVADSYAAWRIQRDRMLPPLQLGPTMTIAYKLERANLKEAALDEWLRAFSMSKSDSRKSTRVDESIEGLAKELRPNKEWNSIRALLK